MFNRKGLYFQNDGAGSGSGDSGDANNDGGERLTFDTFIAKQPEEVKALLDGHTRGLKSALDSERETRKGLEKQVRDLATKAEKGSEAEKQLTALADQMSTSDRKAAFYEDAHAAGVTNLKLAFFVASTEELFDKKGNVNFEDLKKSYPELFGSKKTPSGNAGEGTDETILPSGSEMNRRIRRQAGRG